MIHHTWTPTYIAQDEYDDASMVKNLFARWLSEENIDGDEWEEREEDFNGICELVHKPRRGCSQYRCRPIEPLVDFPKRDSFHQHAAGDMSVAAASTSYVLPRYPTTLAYATASSRLLLYTRIHRYGYRHTTSSRRQFASAPPVQPTTPPRPFTFHVGLSFIGKPVTSEDPPPISKPFPHDHPAVTFRDKMLRWPKEVPSDEAGHDFFFVQDVCSKMHFCVLFISLLK
jgi:hypothetical protein